MTKIWTIGELLQWTQQFFVQKGIDSARLDAEILLAHVLRKERIYLYSHYDEPMNPQELSVYRDMVKQRAGRLSVAHILGRKAFMGMDFCVNRDVLVPRPETELLVETILEQAGRDGAVSVLDIGTGSGAVILSILQYMPQACGSGVDISPQALAVAKKNGAALQLSERVTWIESDIVSGVSPQVFDWIVSNPPYLTQADMEQLEPEVRYDPPQALFGGTDGLDIYRRMAEECWSYLKQDGFFAVEIGAGQANEVIAVFTHTGMYGHVRTVKDYGGIERVILFTRKG
ncbi:modification methylase HemK [Megasphaera cerevisiae DSM 20462]|jgi:release factor glutamine methyltransferase|uniref:Release factor glutamine methyltransferase n=1 Tax=Megasphaera cerevisiae DSM 20462 TaxID=1122219 RepID=A0A0J6WZ88_9FIRM|nr:peptide chain release factor N(5)-glutamine methyltransferase [Megasphaera cerevisiae]KMO87192.1 modification methylase HemK [Megasphaera cerevisiae DSM 20462]MCI1750874.1 peptide chain release factor N(5)-glutamine methyltransferase [Megasphaera cerevisiae]OKY54192.1 protein-(glutamine-N5) methyltransferase, release factor-specific [Megasphaera cerevisiae]SJZ60215.1 release factor glutamine methyltransferase [Megasphaera cerevisiae DSM 20462]